MNQITSAITKFRDDRDWKQFHTPKDVALSLVLEASEVLELMQWKNGQALDDSLAEKREALGDELADVLYYTLLLAHDQGIDIEAAFARKMERNAAKYPVELAKGSSAKYTELNATSD
ncbi:MAG: nucleotide pyrophosphohydrolase [Armatimonadota bacterium]